MRSGRGYPWYFTDSGRCLQRGGVDKVDIQGRDLCRIWVFC